MYSTVCDQLCCEYMATVLRLLSYYEVQTRISEILNDIGRNSLLGYRKKIAKYLMRSFTCRSTFLYGMRTLSWLVSYRRLSPLFQLSLTAVTLGIYLGGEDPLLLHGAGSLPSLELIPIRHSSEGKRERSVYQQRETSSETQRSSVVHSISRISWFVWILMHSK